MAHDILHRVGINASQGEVFKTLTTLEGNQRWWDSGAKGAASKGEVLTFFKSVDFEVVEVRPGELVKWRCLRGPEEWVGTEVSFDLARRNEQTFVLFKHAGWKQPVEFMHHCSTKWATFLLSLKALLETGKGRPAPDDVHIYIGG